MIFSGNKIILSNVCTDKKCTDDEFSLCAYGELTTFLTIIDDNYSSGFNDRSLLFFPSSQVGQKLVASRACYSCNCFTERGGKRYISHRSMSKHTHPNCYVLFCPLFYLSSLSSFLLRL